MTSDSLLSHAVRSAAATALACGIAAGVSACGDAGVTGSAAARPRTPRTGQLRPIHVEGVLQLNGGPLGPGGNPGIPGTVVLTGEDGKSTSTTTAQNGRFKVEVAPGRYRATGASPKYARGRGVCRSNDDVVVSNAAVTHVVVRCEAR
jgi:hypothetical protein